MLYVSFPKPPNTYPRRRSWHSQLSHKVFHGLVHRFGSEMVEFIDWEKVAPVGPRDLVVTFLPNVNFHHTDRIIGVENDTLIPERWSSPVYSKNGIEARTDDLRDLVPLLSNAAGYCVLSNDVAIGKLRAGDNATKAHVDFFSSKVDGNYVVCPHPVDKKYKRGFNKRRLNRNTRFSRHRMAVYHRGWRKSSQATIDLLKEMGYREGRDYTVIEHVKKSNPLTMYRFNRSYNIVFSGSFSETGPINMLEFLILGFVVAGHEDWWDGYGFPQTVWSYDPGRIETMRENLAFLLDDGNLAEMEHHRDRILAEHLAREDNEWDYFCDRLAGVVRRALER